MDALMLEPWMILLFFSVLLLGCCFGCLAIGKNMGEKLGIKIGEQKLLVENALLKQKLQYQQQQQVQQQEYNQELHQQQQQSFENLSHKIFNEKQQQNRQGLDAILHPFKDQLEGLRKKVEDVHLHDAKDRAALKSQINELYRLNQDITAEASALTKALRGNKKTQGNWGELVLETVLERSGLRLGEEYVREQNHKADDGQNYRPDVIINLPDDKHIIVDAKVSLNAYNDYVNTDDEASQAQCLKQHIDAVRNHIKSLSAKAYQHLPSLHSPDFVFMFMPVEPAFLAAFQHDEKLFMDAFDQRIVVVTPTTLLASLRTIESLWSIERRGRSADELSEHASKVYDRLRIVVEKMDKLGSQLHSAQKTYDETYSSLAQGRGNLVNTANQFVELGVRIKKKIPQDKNAQDKNAQDKKDNTDETS
ncbi:MAG: DNA recombination protein RmuC [Oleispira sp.]|jgi:DNA recombination protein RmuC